MNFFAAQRFFLVVGVMLLLAGCAQNTVRLVYTPADPEMVPQSKAPSICVVAVQDIRTKTAIGERSDGTEFLPESSVAAWFTQSIAAELTRQGFVVTTAPTEAVAAQGPAQYILISTIQDVWLKENSSTLYDCKMTLSIVLKGRSTPAITNTFNSSLSRRVVPLSKVPSEMLTEAMGDIVRPLAHFIKIKVMP